LSIYAGNPISVHWSLLAVFQARSPG